MQMSTEDLMKALRNYDNISEIIRLGAETQINILDTVENLQAQSNGGSPLP